MFFDPLKQFHEKSADFSEWSLGFEVHQVFVLLQRRGPTPRSECLLSVGVGLLTGPWLSVFVCAGRCDRSRVCVRLAHTFTFCPLSFLAISVGDLCSSWHPSYLVWRLVVCPCSSCCSLLILSVCPLSDGKPHATKYEVNENCRMYIRGYTGILNTYTHTHTYSTENIAENPCTGDGAINTNHLGCVMET